MTKTNVDTLKLQQAIRQFGSLQAAMEAVEGEEKALRNWLSIYK